MELNEAVTRGQELAKENAVEVPVEEVVVEETSTKKNKKKQVNCAGPSTPTSTQGLSARLLPEHTFGTSSCFSVGSQSWQGLHVFPVRDTTHGRGAYERGTYFPNRGTGIQVFLD